MLKRQGIMKSSNAIRGSALLARLDRLNTLGGLGAEVRPGFSPIGSSALPGQPVTNLVASARDIVDRAEMLTFPNCIVGKIGGPGGLPLGGGSGVLGGPHHLP